LLLYAVVYLLNVEELLIAGVPVGHRAVCVAVMASAAPNMVSVVRVQTIAKLAARLASVVAVPVAHPHLPQSASQPPASPQGVVVAC